MLDASRENARLQVLCWLCFGRVECAHTSVVYGFEGTLLLSSRTLPPECRRTLYTEFSANSSPKLHSHPSYLNPHRKAYALDGFPQEFTVLLMGLFKQADECTLVRSKEVSLHLFVSKFENVQVCTLW